MADFFTASDLLALLAIIVGGIVITGMIRVTLWWLNMEDD